MTVVKPLAFEAFDLISDTPAPAAGTIAARAHSAAIGGGPDASSLSWRRGYERGFEEGRADGAMEGLAAGLAQGRDEGRAEALAEGETAGRDAERAALADARAEIDLLGVVERAVRDEDRRRAESGAAAAHVVAGLIHALTPRIADRGLAAEAAAETARILEAVEPAHAVLRVAPSRTDAVEAALADLEPALRARISVAAEPGLGEATAAVDWRDGFTTLDLDAAAARLAALADAHFSPADAPTPAAPHSDPALSDQTPEETAQ